MENANFGMEKSVFEMVKSAFGQEKSEFEMKLI